MYTAFHLHRECIAVVNLTIFQCSVSQKTQSESKAGAVTSSCAPELCQELPCPTGAAPRCLSSLARIYCCPGIPKTLRPGRSIRGSPRISQHKQAAQIHALSPKVSPVGSAQNHKPVQMSNHRSMEYPAWEF